MKKQYVAVTVFVLTVLVVAFLAVSLSWFNSLQRFISNTPTPSTLNGSTIYTYKIVKTYPHNTTAFTEGLVFENGVLYESTGQYGFIFFTSS